MRNFCFMVICFLVLLAGRPLKAELVFYDIDNQLRIGNGEMILWIEKSTARIVSMKYKSQEMLAPGQNGYFTLIAAERGVDFEIFAPKNCTYNINVNNEHTLDIAFIPENSPIFPFSAELHIVLRDGDAGFYFYLVAKKNKETPDAEIVQFRYGIRLDHSMLNIQVNDKRKGSVLSTEEILNAQGKVMDATYLLESGEIHTKYEWSTPTGDAPVYGLHNGSRGIWMIRGGSDYLNGGPTKQHNTCHGTDKGPILLNLLYSSHYGSGGSYVSGDWQKVFGPTFVYFNEGASAEQLWEDAKQQEEKIRKSWPYAWMEHPAYPVKRAEVSGYFPNVDTGWVVLARPKEFRGLDWQQQGGDSYIHRARIYKNGLFAIPDVRKGSYTLYAFAPGIVGEYRQDSVTVSESEDLYLGRLEWKEASFGDLIWRIGYPDRSAREYKHGDDHYHWGLWFNYLDEFPDDVHFKIGESQETEEWNYGHMTMWIEEGGWKPKLDGGVGEGYWYEPVWSIRFNHEESAADSARLTFGLAGVSRDASLFVKLNGENLASFGHLSGDGSIHRNGIYGFYRKIHKDFETARLNTGMNTLELVLVLDKLPKTRTNYSMGIMYDFIQLEFNKAETIFVKGPEAPAPKVYPNPASEWLKVVLPSQLVQGTCMICDMTGNIILHCPLQGNVNHLDMSNVQPGLYVMTVTAGGRTFHQKIIIQ